MAFKAINYFLKTKLKNKMKQNSENQSHSMQNVYVLKDVINRILLTLSEFNLKKSISINSEKVQTSKVESSEKVTNFTRPYFTTDEQEDPNDLLVAGEYPKISTELIECRKDLNRWEY